MLPKELGEETKFQKELDACNKAWGEVKMKRIGAVTNKDRDFAIVRMPYSKKQHPNQQCGIDEYVDVIDLGTGNLNVVKLYENTKGKHFKKEGTHYIKDFTIDIEIIPFQAWIEKELISLDYKTREYAR